jgi:hypothetical protein
LVLHSAFLPARHGGDGGRAIENEHPNCEQKSFQKKRQNTPVNKAKSLHLHFSQYCLFFNVETFHPNQSNALLFMMINLRGLS